MNAWQKTGYVLGRIAAPIAIVALGVGGLWVFGQKPNVEEKPETESRKTLVETVTVQAFDGTFLIEVEGVAVPLRLIQTSAQVAGLVTMTSPNCRGGRHVSKGETLIEIDLTDYALERDRLQAQLDQATEQLSEVDVQLESTQALLNLAEEDVALKERNLKRVKELYSRGASTDAGLDDAREEDLASRNARQSLQNQLNGDVQRRKTLQAAQKLVQAELKRAEANLARTIVRAPVSGSIVTSDVEQGDYVKIGDPLFLTHDADDMEVSLQLRVDELAWVWTQRVRPEPSPDGPDDVRFEIPNVPVEVAFTFQGVEYLWDGELSRYEGTGLDAATRTIPCRVLVPEPRHVRTAEGVTPGLVSVPTLVSGMYVKVRIPIKSPVPLIQVPARALQPGGEVWTVREGTLAIEPVDVARIQQSVALLRRSADGLRPGDVVVVSPLAAPVEGLAVESIDSIAAAGEPASPGTNSTLPDREDASR